VILPYLIIRQHYRMLIPVLLFSLLFLFVPAIYYGWDHNLFLLSSWWKEINPSAGNQYALENDLGPHSLNALIPSLLMETKGDYPMRRNVLNLDANTVMFILNCIRGALILFTLWFTGIRPQNTKDPIRYLREISYILLLIPLIFPHQQKYTFVFAYPAIIYLTWFLISKTRTTAKARKGFQWSMIFTLFCLAFVLMTLTTDGLVGIENHKMFQHFKLITYGSLLLIPALIMANPSAIPEVKEYIAPAQNSV
jgi:hypothetical protein